MHIPFKILSFHIAYFIVYVYSFGQEQWISQYLEITVKETWVLLSYNNIFYNLNVSVFMAFVRLQSGSVFGTPSVLIGVWQGLSEKPKTQAGCNAKFASVASWPWVIKVGSAEGLEVILRFIVSVQKQLTSKDVVPREAATSARARQCYTHWQTRPVDTDLTDEFVCLLTTSTDRPCSWNSSLWSNCVS